MSVDLLRTHPLLEEIFATHREHARGDDVGYEGYRGPNAGARRALAQAGHGPERR
jgi:hypothetical protein